MMQRLRPVLGCAFIALACLIAGASSAGDAKKPPDKAGWTSLFDGKSLAGWKEANFGGEGEVHVEGGAVVMEQGNDMTGISFAGKDFPRMNYEVTLEGKKLKGRDFFCTTTFPVGDEHCSLVVGGWGGSLVGLSSLNGVDASENETRRTQQFEQDRWYRVRIRVVQNRIQAWIDDKQLVDADTTGKRISIRAECNLCRPFGVATWRTTGAVRDIRVRNLTAAEASAAGDKGDDKLAPVSATLVAKTTTYKLDLGGMTPDAFTKMLRDAEKSGKTPAPPNVALSLELNNNTDKEVKIWIGGDPVVLSLDLKGPSAVTIKPQLAFTLNFIGPKAIMLAPGKTHALPITILKHGFRGAAEMSYWTEAGDYTLTARLKTGISPAPRGSEERPGGFGVVTLTTPPIKLKVEAP